MRIYNVVAAHSDIETFFGVRGSDNESELWVKWLKDVWLKHLFKTDPGWCYPVTTKEPPKFVSGLKWSDKLFVEVPKFGRIDLHPLSEWDVKDSKAGTLVYYQPSHGTLFQYSGYLAPLRDYLKQVVFKDQGLDFNYKKYAVKDVETAAEKWHAEAVERALKLAEDERKRRAALYHAEETRDWVKLLEFKADGIDYVLVRLLTQVALSYESECMHHCISGYGSALYDGTTVLLSVRKASEPNKPKVSAELMIPNGAWQGSTPYLCNIVQVRGPCNEDADKFIPRIVENFPVLLRSIERDKLKPLQREAGDRTFKVELR